MHHPDQKYIDALLNNDTALIREMYDKFFGSIRSMILKNKGSETDACDIFQDGLLAVCRSARKGEVIIYDSFYGFLYTVCRNKWLKEFAKRKLQGVTFDASREHTIEGTDISCLLEEFELSTRRKYLIKQQLEKLCESCRNLLKLSWNGKRMEEVAYLMNVSYGYARKRKSEFMAKLVKLVKESDAYKSLKQ